MCYWGITRLRGLWVHVVIYRGTGVWLFLKTCKAWRFIRCQCNPVHQNVLGTWVASKPYLRVENVTEGHPHSPVRKCQLWAHGSPAVPARCAWWCSFTANCEQFTIYSFLLCPCLYCWIFRAKNYSLFSDCFILLRVIVDPEITPHPDRDTCSSVLA